MITNATAQPSTVGYRQIAEPPREQIRIIVNQPIEKVIASLLGDNSRDVSTGVGPDPSWTRTDVILRREIATRFTFYAVPGGTQVTTSLTATSLPFDILGSLAVRLARRRAETSLRRLRASLE